MKFRILALSILAGIGLSASAQGDKNKRQSPPATMEHTVNDAHITIKYSQPSVKERDIYGGLVPYGKVWRTGANEATTFTTDKAILVNGKALKPGTYSLFTIPNKDKWTIIFNSEGGLWGAYKYDEEKDVLRVEAIPQSSEHVEMMTFTPSSDYIYLDWASTRVPLKIEVK